MVDVNFDETNGSQVEQLWNDVGVMDPTEAINDLTIEKINPMEVKESTSSIEVEPSTSHQCETQANEEAPPNIDENEKLD